MGRVGIEPTTSALSRQRSPAELAARDRQAVCHSHSPLSLRSGFPPSAISGASLAYQWC